MAEPRKFDLGRPFVALVPLLFDERRFAVGEVVPWRELGLGELRVFRLWGQYKIGHAAAAAAPVEAPPPPKIKGKRAAHAGA